MKSTEKRTDFLKQAGILAIAGIICRIIGILYRSPLTTIIGDEGNGYYSAAYNIYTIILLISSYSIPSAISKEIAQLHALREYRNAQKFFHCTLVYVMVVGVVASILTFCFGSVLVESNSAAVLHFFIPTIFLSGFLGVFRGYFQGHGSMVQTSISQILEQLINAIISIVMAYLFIQLAFEKDKTSQAVSGAIGSALGTGAGVLLALLFMIFVYLHNKKIITNRIARDKKQRTLPYQVIFKQIFLTVTPIVLSTFIYNLSFSLNQIIHSKISHYIRGFQEKEIAIEFGVFAGKSVMIINIPIAIAAAVSTAVIPDISSSCTVGDIKATNRKVNTALQSLMMVAVPATVGIAIHAKAIVQLLFPQKETLQLASDLLRILSITVIFYSLSTLTNAVLQAIGKQNIPVKNAFLALILQTTFLVIILLATKLNIYGLAFAAIVYSGSMCLLNGAAIKKYLDYRIHFLMSFGYPAFASLLMGIVSGLTYLLAFYLCKNNTISLFFSIITALFAYGFTLIKLKLIETRTILKFLRRV